MTETRITGGCQCGAVRYALASAPRDGGICHCRMCQKATGGAFLLAASVPNADLRWTRGTPATFHSSSFAARDFCAACGTPLTFRFLSSDHTSLTLGSLDEPAAVSPMEQYGTESRLPWWDRAASLPGAVTTMPAGVPDPVSFQHPDHDTDGWTPHA